MYRRATEDISQELAVVFTPEGAPLWPAAPVIADRNELTRIRLRLVFFFPEEREAAEVVDVSCETPAGTLANWCEFLAPPLSAVEPPFRLDEADALTEEPRGTIRVKMLTPKSAAILLHTLHLDLPVLVGAATVLARHCTGRDWPTTWHHSFDADYGEALYAHHCLLMRADRKQSRADYIEARAEADDFWVNVVTPRRVEIDRTRIIEIDDTTRAWEDAVQSAQDCRLFNPRVTGQLPQPPHPDFTPSRSQDPQVNRETLEMLLPWEERFPELKVSRALRWLEKSTSDR